MNFSLFRLALCVLVFCILVWMPRSLLAEDQALNNMDAGASNLDSVEPAKKTPEWTPKINASVKPAQALLGDPIEVEIKVRHKDGVSVNLPVKLDLGKFTELSRNDSLGKKDVNSRETVRIFTLKVAAYEIGELSLPPIEVTALGPKGELLTLKTMTIPIRIKGLLQNEPNPKLKNIEGAMPVSERTWLLLYLFAGVVAIILIALITLFINRRLNNRKKRQRPLPPPIPADQYALQRLSEIQIDEYLSKQDFKALYLLLSEIMREYFGRRWGFDALEMTTTEIGFILRQRTIEHDTRIQIVLVLQDYDLVKFAKFRPDEQAIKKSIEEAEQIIRKTAPLAAQIIQENENQTPIRVSVQNKQEDMNEQ